MIGPSTKAAISCRDFSSLQPALLRVLLVNVTAVIIPPTHINSQSSRYFFGHQTTLLVEAAGVL